MDNDYVKKLVMARLNSLPPSIGFSVGAHGNLSRDDIIREVNDNSPIGREFAKMELRMILDSPGLAGRLGAKTVASH